MQITKKQDSKTKVTLDINAEEADLTPIKKRVVSALGGGVKVPGFRQGTAPLNIVEKNIDPTLLQQNFLDEAMTSLYTEAARNENIRPVTRPDVQLKKFVPFSKLEFSVSTEIVSDIKIGQYSKISAAKQKIDVTEKEINEVIENLRIRMAEKKPVDRAAKAGDQAWIDFKGVDASDKPISGADGKDYPIGLGSNTFIPGFEENVIGMKPGEEKDFEVKFPADYGAKHLAGKKAKFTVKLNKVEEVIKPKLDSEFAKKAGPFETIAQLKSDIKKQMKIEKEREAERKRQSDVVAKVVDNSTMNLPESLIDQQTTYQLDELRRNLTYQGQTYQEFLAAQGMKEDEYEKNVVRPDAERQVKTSLVLAEIAEKEKFFVTPEELEIRIQMLKGQYKDQAMRSELDKDENRRDIASRMLTEKVVELLLRNAG